MVGGMVINIIGGGLITMLSINSTRAIWSTALALNGAGMGIAMQLPYTAVQLVLRYHHLYPIYRLRLT